MLNTPMDTSKRGVDVIHDLGTLFDAGRRSDESWIVDVDIADVCVEAAVEVVSEDW